MTVERVDVGELREWHPDRQYDYLCELSSDEILTEEEWEVFLPELPGMVRKSREFTIGGNEFMAIFTKWLEGSRGQMHIVKIESEEGPSLNSRV